MRGPRASSIGPWRYVGELDFARCCFEGDTDFTQTKHLDRWDAAGNIRFIFGIDAMPNLVALAQRLPESAYGYLEHPQRQIKTVPRQRPERHKARIVRERKFETIHTREEMVSEFNYRPVACHRDYRVVRGPQAVDRGRRANCKCSRNTAIFSISPTTVRCLPSKSSFPRATVAIKRIRSPQLKGGVYALTTPVDDLISNWAYMVMASLAWSLKAWAALLVP